MGKKALQINKATRRKIRTTPLTDAERANLHNHAAYEGSPLHKKNPGNFGLTPPAAPRPDKTLCDEAGIDRRETAAALFQSAINRGIVSETRVAGGLPKQLWAVSPDGCVFEAIHGGSQPGRYHGYPIRRTDPLFDEITEIWGQRS